MFSVVIPLYNKSITIEKTLKSVFNQTFQEFEIIIIDDGSTDDGVDKVRALFSDKRLMIISQYNNGVSVARNNGISLANYEYVAFLDGDDEWLPDYLRVMKDAIDKYPNAGMYCCAGYVKDNSGIYPRMVYKYKNKISKIEYFENPHVYTHISATVITKKGFEKTKGFPVGMKKNEDFAFLFSLALNVDVVYCGIPLSIYNGDVVGQATSDQSRKNGNIEDTAKRYNLCHEVWIQKEKKNKLFLIFERYEIRHTILIFIKNNDYQGLELFFKNLSEYVLNDFSVYECYLWKSCMLRNATLIYLYFTKLIWRTHGFPVVGKASEDNIEFK